MSNVNHSAHVGFHGHITNIAHWFLRAHGLYIATLCVHNIAGAPAAKGEGPYSDGYYTAYPRTPPPPDLEQPAAQRRRLSSWRYKVALLTRDSASPPDGGGATVHNPQPTLDPLTASQPSERPASPEDIPTEDAAPPGGHHNPSSGENPTSPAEAAEPAILGGF